MKNIFLIVLVGICVIFMGVAFGIRQEVQVLRNNSLGLKQEINKAQNDLDSLKSIPKSSLAFLGDNFQSLDSQINLFARYRGFKISLNIEGLGQDGNIALVAKPSHWHGINQMVVALRFYDLKQLEQYLVIYKFLKNLSSDNPLEILNVAQSNDQVEIRFQLYGRCV